MRIFVLLFLSIAIFTACQNTEVKKQPTVKRNKELEDTSKFTTIKWIDSLKEIGTVLAGKTTEVKFRFQNTGDKPLIVVEAKPGCGCTVADYPEEPILPGKQGVITANYKVPADGHGEFRKNLRVTTNTKGSTDTYIFFSGKIKSATDSTAKKG